MEEPILTIENIHKELLKSIKLLKSNKTKTKDYIYTFSPNIVEEIAKLIDTNKQLQQELDKYKAKEKEIREWCYKKGQELNATDILDILVKK